MNVSKTYMAKAGEVPQQWYIIDAKDVVFRAFWL